jgi:cytochrome oxidase assembly protein ShyY1
MIGSTLLTLPQKIHNAHPTILLAWIGLGIVLLIVIVAFVWKVITALANASIRNDLD